MDLADGGVLREQQPVTPAEVGDVAQQHEHTDDPVGLEQRQRLDQHGRVAVLDLLGHGQALADSHVDRVLVEAHLGEVQARRVRVDPEPVHRAHRVRAGEADAQFGVEDDHAVADAGRVLELVVVLAEREAALGDHAGEAVERREVELLELTELAPEGGAGLAGDDGHDRPRMPYRDALHVRRSVEPRSDERSPSTISPVRSARATSGRATSSTTEPTRSIG